MRTSRIVALGLVALSALACGTSKVPNDAEVTIAGVLKLPDGRPAAGVSVGLIAEPGGLDALAEISVAISTVGIACLTRTLSICKSAKMATTDANGQYAFRMSGEGSKTMLGNPSPFLLSAQMPAGTGEQTGPSVQTRFEVNDVKVDVPPVTFWRPNPLTVHAGASWIDYTFVAFDGGRPRYTVTITDGETEVWSQDAAPRGRLDARVAADLTGGLHATATLERSTHGMKFTTAHLSQRIAMSGAGGVPPSRFADCSIAGQAGAVAVRPCVFTDGRYGGTFPTQFCDSASPAPPSPSGRATKRPCPANTWIMVDLGERRAVGEVLLHSLSLSGDLVVETSDEGLNWAVRSSKGASLFLLVALRSGVAARYVRMRSASGNGISNLAELAVWP